jgi:CDP-diacylglycerol--serine O-phosphatidyltransferase
VKPQKRKVRVVHLLPSAITLGNCLCGFVAILKVAEGIATGDVYAYEMAAWYILIGMLFDALDGHVARVARFESRFGIQLDSLCDVITFGVAPAFLVKGICTSQGYSIFPERFVLVLAIFYTLCAVLRLARFNVETSPNVDKHMDFSGLPSPAAAGIIASSVIPWTVFSHWGISQIVISFLPICMLFLGLLMVSRIRYAHLINRFLKGPKPFINLVELMLFLILLALLHEFAIFAAFFIYTLTGPVLWVRHRLQKKALHELVVEPEEPLF